MLYLLIVSGNIQFPSLRIHGISFLERNMHIVCSLSGGLKMPSICILYRMFKFPFLQKMPNEPNIGKKAVTLFSCLGKP